VVKSLEDVKVTVQEALKSRREEILRIAARHGVTEIRVFGSVARGDAAAESDVDFLVEVKGQTTPWFPGGLVTDIERLLGRPVDVVEADILDGTVKERILKEAVPL
jgi:hypothetical protein